VFALSPVSAAYGMVAGRRMRHAPREKVAAPVLCVGNLTVGGKLYSDVEFFWFNGDP